MHTEFDANTAHGAGSSAITTQPSATQPKATNRRGRPKKNTALPVERHHFRIPIVTLLFRHNCSKVQYASHELVAFEH